MAAPRRKLFSGWPERHSKPPEDPLPPPPPRNPREPQRIAKLLARAGVASRREIERMIEEGRIAVDGKPVEKPATLLTSLQGVTVDGVPVKAPAPTRLFRFHKPPGLLTAERDFSGRPTIYDRLPRDLPRVIPVGRLDLNTEGLLLLTTDGELKRQLELPSSKVERTYRARAFGDVSQEQLEDLITGVEIEGVRYGSIDANMERRTGRNVWIEMRLTEGKNREVRRVLEYLGLQVSRLIRVAYGPFVLGDLAPGEVDEVRQHDLVLFRKDPRAQMRIEEGDRPRARAPRPPRRPEADQAKPATRPARPPRPSADRTGPAAPKPRRPGAGPRGRAPDEQARPTGRPQQRRERGGPAEPRAGAAPAGTGRARPQQPGRGPRTGAPPSGSPRPPRPGSPRGRGK
jgi:23S rRNA pseudouridine2605 synthase